MVPPGTMVVSMGAVPTELHVAQLPGSLIAGVLCQGIDHDLKPQLLVARTGGAVLHDFARGLRRILQPDIEASKVSNAVQTISLFIRKVSIPAMR